MGCRKGKVIVSRALRLKRVPWFALLTLLALSFFAEFLCNNKPLFLKYKNHWYFPILRTYPPSLFNESVRVEVDYKRLVNEPDFLPDGWALFPLIPFSPDEAVSISVAPPTPPSKQNWLGTDDRGRDLLARLIYGLRTSLWFGLVAWVGVVSLAVFVGALQGYFGGKVDFIGQRMVEIWNSLPTLYVIIFLVSLFHENLFILLLVWVAFGWIPLSSLVRAEVLRIRKLEYVQAAQAMGASPWRILFRHILPNALSPVVSVSPFVISASISALASLDYLGLGLPPPTASWGELLRQGKENISSWWLAIFPFLAIFVTLLLLNLIGESIRKSAFIFLRMPRKNAKI